MIRQIKGRANNPKMGRLAGPARGLSHHPKNDIVTDNEASSAFEARRRLLLAAEKHLRVKAAGFAGVTKTGMLVDRRDHPDAIPVQRNTLLGVPEAKRCAGCQSYRLAWRSDAPTGPETICLDCQATAPTPAP